MSACAKKCSSNSNCKAFEYGVNYGGSKYKAGDCILNAASSDVGCNGAKYNLDLYAKGDSSSSKVQPGKDVYNEGEALAVSFSTNAAVSLPWIGLYAKGSNPASDDYSFFLHGCGSPDCQTVKESGFTVFLKLSCSHLQCLRLLLWWLVLLVICVFVCYCIYLSLFFFFF